MFNASNQMATHNLNALWGKFLENIIHCNTVVTRPRYFDSLSFTTRNHQPYMTLYTGNGGHVNPISPGGAIYKDIFIFPPLSYKDIFPREFRTYSHGNPDIDEQRQWRRNGDGGCDIDDGLCQCESSTTRLVYRDSSKCTCWLCNPWVCLKASFLNGLYRFTYLLIGFGLHKMHEVI